MRPPTANAISQERHGTFNAVDYYSVPDPYFYAPEDLTFYAYLENAGDAGNNLQAIGSTGRHGFCHLEESYMQPGQSVKKGERIGKMGYTGLTIPAGPTGRHLHWVLLRGNQYVYPPDYLTEPFNGDNEMKATAEFIVECYDKILNVKYKLTDQPIIDYVESGKTEGQVAKEIMLWSEQTGKDFASVLTKATNADLSFVQMCYEAILGIPDVKADDPSVTVYIGAAKDYIVKDMLAWGKQNQRDFASVRQSLLSSPKANDDKAKLFDEIKRIVLKEK